MTLSTSANPTIDLPIKSCHNCRRSRLRCDRSLPGCHKCSTRREQCLGYGPLLRWANAVAVRGKVHGQAFQRGHHSRYREAQHGLPQIRNSHCEASTTMGIGSVKLSLVDPLLQDLGPRHRLYVHHCESLQTAAVCLYLGIRSYIECLH